MDQDLTLIDHTRILTHLKRLLGSRYFRSAPRLGAFLNYVVAETIAGRTAEIKEYSIGVNVFGRRPDFDPKQDSIVRVEAVKLRTRLTEYYREADTYDGVRIRLSKGGYVPEFCGPRSRGDVSTSVLLNRLIAAADLGVWRRTPEGVAFARRNFSRVIELDPSDPRGHVGLAETCRSALDLELESPDTIIASFEKEVAESLRLAPASCQAHIVHSNLLCTTQGISPAALSRVEAALEIEPSNARAHFWRAAVLSGLAYHSEAIDEIHEAVRLEPQSAVFHAYVGRLLFYAGEYEGAIEKLNEVVQIDPSLFVAHLWLTLSLSHSGKFEQSIDVASRMICLADKTVARCCLSYALARARYQEDATRVLEQLLSDFAHLYVSPVWLATICHALDGHSEAEKQIKAARDEKAYPLIWIRSDPRLTSWK